MEHRPADVAYEPALGRDEPDIDVVDQSETWASGAGDDVAAGPVDDGGTAAFDAPDIDASFLDSIEERLADVERALVRLDEGTYGTCEVCGATVDDSVLVDAPATRFCLDHLPISLG